MADPMIQRSPLLELNDLRMHFPIRKGAFRRVVGHVKAVDGVSLRVEDGETLGIVGESGCGKSTLARTVLRIYQPTSGEIRYRSRSGGTVDLATLSGSALDEIHRDLRIVFQDPQSSLNPRLPVIDIIGEVLAVNGIAKGRELEHRVAELMQSVGLRPEYMHRYPHAFSGGERQRIGIARALASNPRLVIADEAVSALDVSVQAQTINLLQDLQEQFGLTYLFVAHDLSVVRHISDNIAVMYVGRVVEKAPTKRCSRRCRSPIRGCAATVNASGWRARLPTPLIRRPAAHFIRAAATPPAFASRRCRACAPSPPMGTPWPVTTPNPCRLILSPTVPFRSSIDA
ncbi:peptide/nickel transport system ATP-binding protein [Rhizobium sp. BK212]|nr:peptide/nickel transport system ATP-binding protein [Rhizobium sp. BK212]